MWIVVQQARRDPVGASVTERPDEAENPKTMEEGWLGIVWEAGKE